MLAAQHLETLFARASSDSDKLSVLTQLAAAPPGPDSLDELCRLLSERLGSRIGSALLSEFQSIGALALDCSGTGGSGQGNFNTSTCVAFVVAAAGVPLVKIGNRSITSASGSSDFLQAAGIAASGKLSKARAILDQQVPLFLLAPEVYPELAELAPLRRQLGRKTILNFAGPLLNPFRPAFRLMGVSCAQAAAGIAEYLSHQDRFKGGFVVNAASGLDEVSATEPSTIYHVRAQSVDSHILDPRGLMAAPPAMHKLPSGPQESLSIFESIISGQDTTSDCYQLIVLNAALCLVASRRHTDLPAAVDACRELLSSGACAAIFAKTRRIYDELSC